MRPPKIRKLDSGALRLQAITLARVALSATAHTHTHTYRDTRRRTGREDQEECTGEAGGGIEFLVQSCADQALVESRRYVTLRLDLRRSTVPV